MFAETPEPVLTPTPRQIDALRAYLEEGNYEAAALRLDISPRTLKVHLAALRLRIGVRTNAQAVQRLWMGYNEHARTCDKASHAACAPRLPPRMVTPSP